MENNAPLVSVLTTVYNREKYLAQAIESILNSTYENWELIIVDDCSTDGSVNIGRQYEAKDSRIKVYINEKNLGDYPNRNKAASYAKGKYLKYVDSDDLIYPYGLEEMVFYMEQFPDAGYGLCLHLQDKDRPYPFQLSPLEAYRYHYFEDKSIFHRSPLSSIIKRASFVAVNGFCGRQHLGDMALWHRLSQNSPVVLMPGAIIWNREHEEQQMTDNLTDPAVPFKYLVANEELILSDNCPLNIEEKIIVLNDLKDAKAQAVVSALRRHSLQKAMELKKMSGLFWFNIFYSRLKI